MPCKHIAAVIYLICAEIDKNPFVVFDIHNCDLLEMISDFGNGKLEHVQKLLLIDDILEHTNCLSNQFDQSVLDLSYNCIFLYSSNMKISPKFILSVFRKIALIL